MTEPENTTEPKDDAETQESEERRRIPQTPWWWLPFALLFSLGIHLLIGVTAVYQGWLTPPTVASNPNGTVRLLIPTRPKSAMPDGKQPVKPTSQATPEPKPSATLPPVPVPEPTPEPEPEKRQRPQREKIIATLPSPKPNRPNPIATPTAGGNQRKRLPVPITRGDVRGDQNLPPDDPPARMVEKPDAPPSPRPITIAETEAGRPAAESPATVAIDTTTKNPVGTASVTPDPTPTESAGTGTAPGAGAGAGRTNNDLGIARGIPFGSAIGLASGGNPAGGGGIGRGPGGGTRGGAPRFTLARPSRPEDGPPVHIVYVIDVSGSMEEGGKIDRVRAAMSKALGELRAEDFFNIVFFSNDATLFSRSMRPATSGNISAGVASINIQVPHGATNLSSALELAFQQSEMTHLFVMSDGDPTEGITDFARLVEFARQRNNSNARIITLALGQGEKFKGMELLRQLAEAGRGKFDYIDLTKVRP